MTPPNKLNAEALNERAMKELLTSVKTLKYGHILITVHDSKIVQVDKTEKLRFNDSPYYEKGSGI